MTFLLRFLLGLPPRPIDIDEIRHVAPEVLSESAPELIQRLRARWPELLVPVYLDTPTLAAELSRWACSLEDEPQPEERRIDAADCPLRRHCPLLAGSHVESEHPAPSGDLAIQLIGGGPQDQLAKRFFGLVKKNSAGLSPESIKRIILTDVYIHDSGGETGKGKGYARLVEYLTLLGARQNPGMRIELTPAPKRGTATKMKKLGERLQRDLGVKDVAGHSTKAAFHDRFYLIEDRQARLRGICGPSLNGLDSDRPAVVLIRELDSDEIKTLSKYLS